MEVNPWSAIDDDDVDALRALLESGAVDPNADRVYHPSDGDAFTETLLSSAAGDGSADMVRMLILHGSDVGGAAADLAPLPRAVLLNRADTARVLLEHGADPRSVWDGQPVLHHAAEGWDAANVTALLAFGADPNARDERGRTALHAVAATARGHLINEIAVGSVIAELIRHGADPALVDVDGRAPRDLASWPAVRALLES